MVGCCAHGDEPRGSIRCREFIDKLRKYGLTKKYSAAWSED
jgi:hypothetical protein